jgi:ParB/RepB/Spo0J family partition protein
MSTVTMESQHVSLDLIDVGENVRDLDPQHVEALAASIAIRGQLVPVILRPNGERFDLVAGAHRYAACRQLAKDTIEYTLREQEGSSADTAAENVMRKQLSPLEEARAVKNMLDEGYTLDGAAEVLGWDRRLVTARVKILALPENAQQLLGSGELPVSAVSVLEKINEVSPALCQLAVAGITEGAITGSQFTNNPAWATGQALRHSDSKTFAAYFDTVTQIDVEALRLGKKANAALNQAEAVHKQLNPSTYYGPPTIRFGELEVDQARAAGVLIEFEHGTPIITDRALYRELVKQAIERTLQELTARKASLGADRERRRGSGEQERTPQQNLDAEHRAAHREFTRQAHGTNLDLGAALLQKLAAVDPDDMDVARFFAYGVLGSDRLDFRGDGRHTVATIAANGIRLVIAEHRTTTTPTLKSGGQGKTKVAYGEIEDAAAWLWKFVDGAKSASELYGRVLVVFAAQHYASDLVLARTKRRRSVLPDSHKDTARKAFERLTKKVLPASHMALQRALEREAKAYLKNERALAAAAPAESRSSKAEQAVLPAGSDGTEELTED